MKSTSEANGTKAVPETKGQTFHETGNGQGTTVSDDSGAKGGSIGGGGAVPHSAQPIPESDSVEQTPTNWDDMPNRGYFRGRPGPGRGHTKAKSRESGSAHSIAPNPAEEGALRTPAALLDAATKAIESKGQRFWKDLAKQSPAVLAQLVQSLTKQVGSQAEQPGTPAAIPDDTNFVVAASPDALPHPSHKPTPAEERLLALERENAALQAKLARLQGPARVMEEREPETWLCKTCLGVAGIERRHPVSQAVCPACGARQDGRPPAKRGAGKPPIGYAVRMGHDPDGWEQADSIGAALRRVRK